MANRTNANLLIHSVALTPAILACTCNVSAQSKFTVLYNFRGGSDGASPQMTLVADNAGALYGTTAAGGGNGTVFKLTPPRQGRIWTETVLHRFADGTTSVGGRSNHGVVFRLK